VPDDPHRPPPRRKRDRTRQRLLESANRRFRAHGYEATTAAEIAADAGVTERTFFRYFPSKADVLVAGWQMHQEALRSALTEATDADLRTVVRDGLLAFTDRVAAELATGIDSVLHLYTDRRAFLAITETLLDVEHDLAEEIARRTSRSPHDFRVRVTANASLGVMRAAIRAAVVHPDGPTMATMVHDGIDELRSVFDAVQAPP
jgi:AcrR family transcriptional regulator